MDAIFTLIEKRPLKAVSSTLTLTEVLKHPIEQGRSDLEQEYRNILLSGRSFRLHPVTSRVAQRAAHLRAQYNLRTPDAIHVATAIVRKCDAFLTNDIKLKRVTETRIIVIDELEPDV